MFSEKLPFLIADRFDEPPEVQLTAVGEIPIERAGQLQSSNTAVLIERIENLPDYRYPHSSEKWFPHGFYRNRHVIGTGTQVLGGVYMGRRPREALVVTDEGPALSDMYQLFMERYLNWTPSFGTLLRSICGILPKNHTGLPDQIMLLCLYDFVQTRMPFHRDANAKIAKDLGIGPDEEVHINEYIWARKGVCRHQVCFFAALVERLQEHGFIDGKVSVQRKSFLEFSHAWARFTDAQGRVYIIDVAQQRHGWLDTLTEHEKFFYE